MSRRPHTALPFLGPWAPPHTYDPRSLRITLPNGATLTGLTFMLTTSDGRPIELSSAE